MKLAVAIRLFAGGPGSGCRGENCGRRVGVYSPPSVGATRNLETESKRMIEEARGKSGLYLLHLDPPLAHAAHYLGYADDIGRRVEQHQVGKSGAKLIGAAVAAGSKLHLVRYWPGATREDERKMKSLQVGKDFKPRGSQSYGSRGRLCPYCHDVPRNLRAGMASISARGIR